MGPATATLQKLANRGVTLMPPAGQADWDRLERCCGFAPGPDFRAVTARFDGFLVHDWHSMMMLWSIDSIIAHRNASTLVSGDMVAIGDFLIDSDLIVARIADRHASVFLLDEARPLAPSLDAFVARIAAGDFDWLA